MRIQDLVKKELLPIKRPVHGGQGWRLSGVEDFSHNLNPYGPPVELPNLVAEAAAHLDHYPDDQSSEFREAVASRHGVSASNVIAGAGSSEIIKLFPEVFISRKSRVIIPRPTFSEYSHACRMQGANILDVPLCEVDGFSLDMNAMLEKLPLAKAMYICNPNNPTGTLEPRRKVLELIDECERADKLVFLDETLLELVEGYEGFSCMSEVRNRRNLFLISSLTKSFAIPGLRVGYGVGSEEIVEMMGRARLSWNLGVIEQYVGTRLIRDHLGHVRRAAEMMAKERGRIKETINGTRLFSPLSGQSFFFFTRINSPRLSAEDMVEYLLPKRVLVRDCSSFGRPFDKFVRFSIKTPEKNDLLIQAMEETAQEIRSTAFVTRMHV
ncbi:MAG: histidinol-phosphate aminotransferase family protein [Methanomassiliicoccales archaeon]|nr:histidinol-phosphate aminotransferase family protein [Methanomassiliicoccales archaeon]